MDLKSVWSDERKRKSWYSGGKDYWEKQQRTNDGVLGGYGVVHEADIADSLEFIKPLIPEKGGATPLRALDVGAGIGRISGSLLLQICDTVDLLDASSSLLAQAKDALQWAGDRVERFVCGGMQDWVGEPERYHLIWIQWCIGNLTDPDMVAFLLRCKKSLAPGGLIVLKDNVMEPAEASGVDKTGQYIIDKDDNSVIRARSLMIKLLTRSCGLTIIKQKDAELKRDDLFPVMLCALRP